MLFRFPRHPEDRVALPVLLLQLLVLDAEPDGGYGQDDEEDGDDDGGGGVGVQRRRHLRALVAAEMKYRLNEGL